MIAIGKLTENMNNGLNALASANDFPFAFLIKSEGGEYTPPKRDGNKVTAYVNGVTRIVDSDVIYAQGMTVSTITVQLDIAYPLPDDIPVEQAIEAIRAVLDAYFKQPFAQSIPDENGNEFAVSSHANIPTTGNIAQSAAPGLMMTFSCSIEYFFIENGVNSNDVVILFEGDTVPYTDYTITRVPVMDAGPYSDTDGAAESLEESTALNIEFTAPILKAATNALFAAYKAFLLTGLNLPHNVSVTLDGTTQEYRMKFGQSSGSFEGVKNGNSRITLVEARELENGE